MERPELLQPPEASRLDGAGRATRFLTTLGGALLPLVEGVISRDGCARDRQLLASLNDRLLRDIGIDRAIVENDSTTSFWRLR